MEAHQSQSYLQDQHESEINCLEQQLSEKNDLTNNLLGIKLKREHLLKQKKPGPNSKSIEEKHSGIGAEG